MNACVQISKVPINFQEFDRLNNITSNLEATLLLTRLTFHHINSKIKKDGKIWIVRSREQISSWYNFNKKKTDKLLSILKNLGLIEKKVGLWYGKKALFININKKLIYRSPINHKSLNAFIEATGSVQNAFIFSRIAFAFNNSKLINKDKKWTALTKQKLADWAKISIRTTDKILSELTGKGLLIKKNLVWKEKMKSHFHIPNFAIEIFNKQIEKLKNIREPIKEYSEKNKKEKSKICRQDPAKKGFSIIKLRAKAEVTNNKTYTPNLSTSNYNSDINFDSIGKELSDRQIRYLEGALKRTVENKKVKISSPRDFFEELKFSVLNSHLQHKGITLFKHVVSRCMKILSDGNWRTPIGFSNYSKYGVILKVDKERIEKEWQEKKFSETPRYFEDVIMNKINKGQNLANEMTEKAMHTAKHLRALIENMIKNSVSPNLIIDTFQDFFGKIKGLIKHGANKEIILPYIETNVLCFFKENL
jgi:hypothetical protein